MSRHPATPRGAQTGGGQTSSNAEQATPPKRRTLFLIPRLVWAAARSAPLSSLLLVSGAVVGGVVAALELVVIQRLVDALAAALAATAAAASGESAGAVSLPAAQLVAVLPWVGWLAAAMVGQTLLELVGHLAEVDVQERVGMHLQRQVILKAHSVELVYFEHPSFYDALERANQDMGGRIVTLMRSLVEVLGSTTGMIAVLVVLWQTHWSLAPIMVVGVVPGFWVMLAMRKKTWWVYRIRTPQNRLSMYFSNLLTRREDAKEVRLFTLARHLLERWLALAQSLAVERRQLESKQAWLGALTSLVSTAAYSGCLLIIASLIAGAAVTVGTFSMLMQALQQFAMRIGQVMQSLSGVHEQSLYLSDLYEFLEIDAPKEETVGEKDGQAPVTAGRAMPGDARPKAASLSVRPREAQVPVAPETVRREGEAEGAGAP
ncbi:MAG TPA: ABC transporter transmembrane domain-containing protein, partial [Limnochordia bacterium]|nr:ABC transporter transmembrane domain-containing protein [Limnochordia bacterium]